MIEMHGYENTKEWRCLKVGQAWEGACRGKTRLTGVSESPALYSSSPPSGDGVPGRCRILLGQQQNSEVSSSRDQDSWSHRTQNS